MPPRKAKLHASTGKLKTINKAYTSGSSTTSSANNTTDSSRSNGTVATRPQSNASTAVLPSTQPLTAIQSTEMSANAVPSTSHDSDADQQFELELCWCIQTLEKSLEAANLSAKQAADTEKALKLLKNNSQPAIRKRQVMRTAFGDYRSKMQDEEKKLRLGSRQIQFVAEPVKNNEAKVKSHFVKKSLAATLGEKNFKFDFPIPEIEKLSIAVASSDAGTANDGLAASTDQTQAQSTTNTTSTTLKFNAPGNSFRFNFNSEN